ncbi:hypothetical protein [Hansschlegelia zhihuaiae]|uniref:Uncharacterized protein n=1 Tax=Hansschlegelia zhihuaiae TaxID=405005 RepID=A0A4Q0MC35_9HYPH|nr:hypothetical protein [Hansschlegelia zhihuaiae]RXF70898.1 hypothetical protein EK403_15930 [Hansschlegelia zhihuaiae]
MHDVLSTTLGKEGYRLRRAQDGVEAIEMMSAWWGSKAAERQKSPTRRPDEELQI